MQLFGKGLPLDTDHRSFRRRVAKELFAYNGSRIPFRVTFNRPPSHFSQARRNAATVRVVLPNEGPEFVFFIEEHFFKMRFTYRKTQISFAYDRRGDTMAEKSLELMAKEEIVDDYNNDDTPCDFTLSSVSSGAWDEEGRFLELWKSSSLDRDVPSTNTNLSLQMHVDMAQLEVRIHHGSIFFGFSSILPSICDGNTLCLYVVIATSPSFVETHHTREVKEQRRQPDGTFTTVRRAIKTKWDPPQRQTGIGPEGCKQMQTLSWVYALTFTSREDIMKLMPLWVPRFREPHFVRIWTVRDSGAIREAVREDLHYLLGRLPFEVAFQAQALIASWHILPHELLALEDTIAKLEPTLAVERLKSIKSNIGWRDPLNANTLFSAETIKQWLIHGQGVQDGLAQDDDAVLQFFLQAARRQQALSKEDRIIIHSVKLTPLGMILEGPYEEVGGNRVIREYPGTNDHYLRVSVCDEDGGFMRDSNGRVDIDDVLYRRFGHVLRQGLAAAGRQWDFLGFSSSQLRSHSCWFVRSEFMYEGKKITAQGIRDNIGDLDGIRCPPRFAARLGQAFTTTLFGVDIETSALTLIDDIKDSSGKYMFSDGVGTISREVVDMLNEAYKSRVSNAKKSTKKDPCSVFQVRVGGAKGVLALDTTLEGRKVCLRSSMIKFSVKSGETIKIEIAERCSRPLPFRLNRPLIPLLESLGVPQRAFLNIQTRALEAIKTASRDSVAAAQLLREYKLGDCVHLGRTFRELTDTFDLSFIQDVPFLREAMKTAMTFALRQLKYTHRIRVEGSCTLMGIMDETGFLREGEVYGCVIPKDGRRTYLKGKCLIFRSPTLHPGDVQFAKAVGKLDVNHPLSALTNCVVFSRRGERPLPSKLAGGDLDGDLYNICFDSNLFPRQTYPAALYPPVKPIDLDRSVQVDDIVDFFIDHTQQNMVGMISTRHLILSDQSESMARDPACIKLAELHSKAVDYPKTGHYVDRKEIPKALSPEKPDFLEDEFRVEYRAAYGARFPRLSSGYYRSDRALGKLFRNIDVPRLLREWGLGEGKKAESMHARSEANKKWEDKLLVALKPASDEWMETYESHRKLISHYYDYAATISDDVVMSSRRTALTEAETFLTCVIGKSPVRGSVKPSDVAEALRERLRLLVRQLLTAAIACGKKPKPRPETAESITTSRSTTPTLGRESDESVPAPEKEEVDLEEAEEDQDLAEKLGLDEDDDANAPFVDVNGDFDVDLDYNNDDAQSVLTQSESRDSECWNNIGLSTTEGTATGTEDDGNAESAAERERRKVRERYYALYSLFSAAVNTQKPERCSAPWIVFPRLVSAWREHRLMSA